MSLTKEQHDEIDIALYNIAMYELGKYDKELTPFEKSLLNPKLYTKEIHPAYTQYVPYKGTLKNKGSLYIHLFEKTVAHGWMISRKRYFKNKIRETSYD